MGAYVVSERVSIGRPLPPREMAADIRHPEEFAPAPELRDWIRAAFLDAWGWLWNQDHEHLSMAVIECLWTNAPNSRQMRTAMATAEMPEPRGLPWTKARQEFQLVQWFGHVPDFLLTFDAPLCSELDNPTWCALVEHELYHCAQAVDRYGSPRWHRNGTPVFGIRGHDVEEFVGVVRRYGAVGAGVGELVAAAKMSPLVNGASIAQACGTCAQAAA